ncbi:MAG: MurR/RpiR family transcriptional regulator [Bacteroidetes bacterium]|nr:MurR/RpiR family transcriptional regulator [Bacteroidota bacterium]MBU1113945.1 MurR/RpiR family transcriptional regulator [Bacteroidota bacterium]MBU1798260.1 MurR/RpiR family transcriptional regulator [Bacteroidota bacterium]
MARYYKIKNRIQDNYDSLSKNHKILANYFIDNFDNIPFLSVQQIAEATLLSVASVVRFAQKIGFNGYLEMREEISLNLQELINKKDFFTIVDDENNWKEDHLTLVANQEIKNISETVNSIDPQNFDKSIKMILQAKRVFTVGLGVSYMLAEILAYQISQVGIAATNFSHSHSSFAEQILHVNNEDLLIALSFPPYSLETIESAKYAKQRNVKVIAITDKTSAPISRFSDVQLIVKTENMLFTNSFSAISVLINAITTECALQNRIETNKIVDELNRIVDKTKFCS